MIKKDLRNIIIWATIFVILAFFMNRLYHLQQEIEIPYSLFKKYINEKTVSDIRIRSDLIRGIHITNNGKKEYFKTIPVNDPKLIEELEKNDIEYRGEKEQGLIGTILINFGPVVLFLLIWFLMIKQMQGGGKQVIAFSRSKAKLQSDKKIKVTFNDVAGCDEAKEELQEIIEFLKDPRKFQRLGGKIPKGVILYGAPGTGKTLLAKAVAGEAGVPFFSSSGSEFVEMFVGVGASRVRDLFEQGRRNAPCLLFIDEIDAVGRHRFAGIGGGHDEREQTLNQLLVEMDGFDTKEGVILIAATNRPDVLDPALLRPGRFDRHIVVPTPDLKGREDILKIHTRNIKLSKDVDLRVIARRTPGFVGADLANLVNEAALLAARHNKQFVEMEELEEAIDRVIAGPQRKSRMISDREKKIIAYHESGHALVAKLIPGCDPVHKVSIVPRGPALGYTLQLPLEDKYLTTKTEILNKVTVLLGGRCAELIVFNELTTGGQNDLSKATEIVQKMISEYGMSERLGPIVLRKREEEMFLGRDIVTREKMYSEKTAEIIDEEVEKVINECEQRAKKLLTENRNKLELISNKLIECEVLDGSEVDEILGIVSNIEKTNENDRQREN
jgi:cell division protease FtsH